MLGKLLWCMVSGRLVVSEMISEAEFNLERLESPHMERINLILDECVVAKEHMCLRSATELLTLVDETIRDVSGANLILPNGDLRLGCVICGKGTYKLQTPDDGSYIQLSLSDGMVRGGETRVRAFVLQRLYTPRILCAGVSEGQKNERVEGVETARRTGGDRDNI